MRILIAGFLGGIILFVWGTLAWVVIQLHGTWSNNLPEEERIVAMFSETITEPGVYWFPGFPEEHDEMTEEEREQAMDAWREQYEAGPIGMLFIDPDGKTPFHPVTMATGFGINLLTGFVVAILLAMTAKSLLGYVGRVLFVIGIGAIIILHSHLSFWNWLNFPADFTLTMALDTIIGWTLLGLVVGAVIRPKSADA